MLKRGIYFPLYQCNCSENNLHNFCDFCDFRFFSKICAAQFFTPFTPPNKCVVQPLFENMVNLKDIKGFAGHIFPVPPIFRQRFPKERQSTTYNCFYITFSKAG